MKNNSNLEFRKIPSLLFLYEINENGTVFRNVKSKKCNKIKLDMHHSKVGYYCTFVRLKGVTKRVMIHKVVAECWLGKCPEGLEVDHIDRNPHNNHYTNLRYVTHSGQMKNRVLSDRIIEGAKRNCMKYVKEVLSKPVYTISPKGFLRRHYSMTECARFLQKHYPDKTVEHLRGKLKQRRKKIYDFRIVYSPKCRDLTQLPK